MPEQGPRGDSGPRRYRLRGRGVVAVLSEQPERGLDQRLPGALFPEVPAGRLVTPPGPPAGIRSLGTDFAAASEPERVRKLEAIEPSPFFQSVRLKTVMVLYDNPIAWAHFGYEGEAFSKGGYLFRGFNDLRWLPEVPEADSGVAWGK